MRRLLLGFLLICTLILAACGRADNEEYALDYVELEVATTTPRVHAGGGLPPGVAPVGGGPVLGDGEVIEIWNTWPQPGDDFALSIRQIPISASGDRSAAVMADGTVYTWGDFLSQYIGEVLVAATHLGGELLITNDGGLLLNGEVIAHEVVDIHRGVEANESYIIRSDGSFKIFDIYNETFSPYHIFSIFGGSDFGLHLGRGIAATGNAPGFSTFGGPAGIRTVTRAGNSYILTYNNQLWGWGGDGDAPLGHAAGGYEFVPVFIMEDVAQISPAGTFMMALTNDDRLYVWGWGNLGLGAMRRQGTPTLLMENVAYMAAGDGHSMIITRDGQLWGFGDNHDGEVGDGTFYRRNTPVAIMSDVAAVSVGESHTLAVTNDGRLWGWGSNLNGQLGDSVTQSSSSPVYLLSGVRLP